MLRDSVRKTTLSLCWISEVDAVSLEVSRTQVISGLEELSLITGTIAPGPNLPPRRHRRRSPVIRRVTPTLSGGRTHIPLIPPRARPTATETLSRRRSSSSSMGPRCLSSLGVNWLAMLTSILMSLPSALAILLTSTGRDHQEDLKSMDKESLTALCALLHGVFAGYYL